MVLSLSMNNESDTNLSGKFLLAMPGMGDPRFHKAVILVCAHDDNGAMGLVINHMLPGIDLENLLKQLNIATPEGKASPAAGVAVMSGGPVDNVRGFVVHTPEFHQQDTVRINDQISVTGTVDALRAVAIGEGPQQMIFVLGYSGWGPGQLDQELQDNAWLVFDAAPEIIFETEVDQKWDAVIRRMGIDPSMLSNTVGRA
jgi:putative transcriptional regulator